MMDKYQIARSMFFKTDYSVVSEEVANKLDDFSRREDLVCAPSLIGTTGETPTPEIRISSEYSVTENVNRDEEHKWFDAAMFEIVSACVNKYVETFPMFNYAQDSGYKLLKYRPGGHYAFHGDDTNAHRGRVLSFLYYLNDDYEGGEFQMWEDGEKIKMPKGSVAVFPSTEYYQHRVLPVTEGERRCVVTWMHPRSNYDNEDG